MMDLRHPAPRTKITLAVAVLIATSLTAMASSSAAASDRSGGRHAHGRPVSVDVKAPSRGDNAGIGGAAWIVDLALRFPGGSDGLRTAGFTSPQLTGPGVHNNVPPFPGTFSTGQDDRLPGLVVLVSTTNATLPGFSGPGTNLANLFNVTGVTDRSRRQTELWDTWIVGAPIAGQNVNSVLTVAVIADRNQNGVYDDAPPVVPDANGDGQIDRRDVRALGVASNIETVPFRINGAPA
jgi:hypothetical protein